jgi:predicted signal transduction protein with EAL and GGDEF domain
MMSPRAMRSLFNVASEKRCVARSWLGALSPQMEVRQLSKLERSLRHADLESEMSSHFQPSST